MVTSVSKCMRAHTETLLPHSFPTNATQAAAAPSRCRGHDSGRKVFTRRSHPLTCVRVCMFRHLTQHARAGLGVCSSTQLLSRRSWRPLARAREAVQDRRDCLKVCIKIYFRQCMRLLALFVPTSVSTPHFYLHTAHLPILTGRRLIRCLPRPGTRSDHIRRLLGCPRGRYDRHHHS